METGEKSPSVVAAVRGLYSAIVAAGLAFFTTWQATMAMTDVSSSDALGVAGVAAGVMGFTVLAARAGVEGYIDTARRNNGGGG